MIPPPPRPTLFPYTTLFRSIAGGEAISGAAVFRDRYRLAELCQKTEPVLDRIDLLLLPTTGTIYRVAEIEARSEEHTSELQSRRDLVCRLLLEKKKKKETYI